MILLYSIRYSVYARCQDVVGDSQGSKLGFRATGPWCVDCDSLGIAADASDAPILDAVAGTTLTLERTTDVADSRRLR